MTHPAQRSLLIGTRGSLLATTQAGHVRQAVLDAGYDADLHIVHTPGDASQAAQIPVATIGVGVFTETLRAALNGGECDIAVHSFKDLPTAPDARFTTVVPPRVDAREVLISAGNKTLMELPPGAAVGTSAPRRIAQVLAVRPDLVLCPLRGNIGTRMARVGQDLDAVILARAGLERVGQLDRAAESIDPQVIMPAPAQGALSVEVRASDEEAYAAVAALDHAPSHAEALAERAVLATLEAGCSAPVAAHARVEFPSGSTGASVTGAGSHSVDATGAADRLRATLRLDAAVFALDGSDCRRASASVPIDLGTDAARGWKRVAVDLGADVGRRLLEAGASGLMAAAR